MGPLLFHANPMVVMVVRRAFLSICARDDSRQGGTTNIFLNVVAAATHQSVDKDVARVEISSQTCVQVLIDSVDASFRCFMPGDESVDAGEESCRQPSH